MLVDIDKIEIDVKFFLEQNGSGDDKLWEACEYICQNHLPEAGMIPFWLIYMVTGYMKDME